ncbi:STAS/SEC14 domain-containing protein [Colwellia sp. RSH04]|uniref:STAS/SEC14 domain-containing protein n=1 Tax=Colwellia sp. RSH04 TaxID=2305464 RepID=UPI000E598ECB|nr:STAS/SEC14 domain-containing protein [Colwellia sp. RSH04]RHW74705.1 STAS/SEC14 domain-containing protein [Colwellia sp. RSH04]
MLEVRLDKVKGIATLEPNGELSKEDFTSASTIIDPYIEEYGELKGIIIHVQSFPGWESFSSLIAHLKFVKNHHKKVSRIAFATDSTIGSFAENIANHFVNAELKSFAFNELESCKNWILNGDD